MTHRRKILAAGRHYDLQGTLRRRDVDQLLEDRARTYFAKTAAGIEQRLRQRIAELPHVQHVGPWGVVDVTPLVIYNYPTGEIELAPDEAAMLGPYRPRNDHGFIYNVVPPRDA